MRAVGLAVPWAGHTRAWGAVGPCCCRAHSCVPGLMSCGRALAKQEMDLRHVESIDCTAGTISLVITHP